MTRPTAPGGITARQSFITERLLRSTTINSVALTDTFKVKKTTACADIKRWNKANPGTLYWDTVDRAWRLESDRSSATVNTYDEVCARCGATFTTRLDHGKRPKFCSRACLSAGHIEPAEKACAACGGVFLAEKATHLGTDTDGRRAYCSKQCADAGRRTGEEVACESCGTLFWRQPNPQSAKRRLCSRGCAATYYTAERSHPWAGGRTTFTASGASATYLPRPGYTGKYLADHRIVAAHAIGRLLAQHEYVIWIFDRHDNAPSNLFICASISEFRKRHLGSLPWPTESNLGTYGDRLTPPHSITT